MATPATFTFSAEELLDALTTISDEPFDMAALASGSDGEPSLLGDPFALANSSVSSVSGNAASTTSTARPGELSVATVNVDLNDSSSEQSSLVESETSPLRNGSPQPKRKRRKHELDAIRALAASLETQLAGLRKRHRPEQPGANLFWRRVADQLLLERHRATAENERLKDIFQDQAKVLKAIHKSIQKSPDLEKLGVVLSPSRPLDSTSVSDIHSRLFDDVAKAYPETDAVLEQAGVRQAADCSRKVKMTMNTDDGRSVMTIEVAESRTVPFQVAQFSESVWGFLTNTTCVTQKDKALDRIIQTSGNDIFGVCKAVCPLGLYTLHLDMAMRRFAEGDRMTFVWECSGRCDDISNPSKSFRMQEKGCAVFEPAPLDPLNKSVLRTCVQFVPQPLDPEQELSTAARDIGLATEIALIVYEKTVGSIYTCVVAELMGEASG